MVTEETTAVAPPENSTFTFREVPALPWVVDAVEKFKIRMLDDSRKFPCVFGVDAVRRDTLRLAAVPAGPDRTERLADALRSFLPRCRELGNRTSLVVLFEPDPALRTVEDHRTHFWSLLQGLHDGDRLAWPQGIAEDTDSPEWEFSFHGEPMFVVANTPAHTQRRSRYFEYFAITFQPRFVFEGLEETSRQGSSARRIIRGRLAEYDGTPPAGNLGSFGAPGNREWGQYFLDDTDNGFDASDGCPFSMHSPERHDRSTT